MSTIDKYEVFDTADVRVLSAETTDIGEITLLRTGLPMIRNLTISYDTLRQWVTLRWNRPATALVKSFNIHRRMTDDGETLFSQLNHAPASDTFYVDSTGSQNRTYEYRISSIIEAGRGELNGAAVSVSFSASFIGAGAGYNLNKEVLL